LISLINVIALIRLITRFANTLYYPVDSIRYGARVCSIKKLRKSHVPEQESVDIRPKYITLQRLGAEYGISKGKAVRMMEDGRIQAVRVVDEGRSRGKVLRTKCAEYALVICPVTLHRRFIRHSPWNTAPGPFEYPMRLIGANIIASQNSSLDISLNSSCFIKSSARPVGVCVSGEV
jgi:hypothetical protein